MGAAPRDTCPIFIWPSGLLCVLGVLCEGILLTRQHDLACGSEISRKERQGREGKIGSRRRHGRRAQRYWFALRGFHNKFLWGCFSPRCRPIARNRRLIVARRASNEQAGSCHGPVNGELRCQPPSVDRKPGSSRCPARYISGGAVRRSCNEPVVMSRL